MSNKPLENPYSECDDFNSARLQTDISQADKLYFVSILPFRGVIQTTLNVLIHDLISELRARGITSYSPDNYAILCECVRRRTHPSVVGQTPERNDAGRTPGLHDSDAVVESESSVVVKRLDGGPVEDNIKGKSRKGKRTVG